MWARFSAPIQTGPAVQPPSYTMGTASFLGVKLPECCVDHPPPSSIEVEGKVELYLYSPLGLMTVLVVITITTVIIIIIITIIISVTTESAHFMLHITDSTATYWVSHIFI